MKNFNLLLLLLIFFSCSQNDAIDISSIDIYEPVQSELSLAINAINAFKKTKVTKSDLANTISYKSEQSIAINNETDSVKLFVFDMQTGEDEGFVIATGHQDLSMVCAYVEKGSLSDTTYNEALRLILRDLPHQVSTLYQKRIPTKSWVDDFRIPAGVYDFGPFLQTQWHQRFPFNMTCTVPSNTCPPPAGCTPVALAQVIAYFDKASSRFGNKFNFSSLKSTHPDNYTVAQQKMAANLVHYIGVKCKASYSCSYTGAWPNDFADFSLLGYNVTNKVSSAMDYNKQYANMKEGRPTIAVAYTDKTYTSGHTFVIDGMSLSVWVSSGFKFFYCTHHINFGWEGSSDGYYTLGYHEYGTYYSFLYFDGFTSAANTNNKTYTGPAA